MKKWLTTLLVFLLVGCSSPIESQPEPQPQPEDQIQSEPQAEPEEQTQPEPQSEPEEQTDSSLVSNFYGPAPELENEIWLNTETPLRLEDLRGKVVLIEMWTFG